MTFTLKQFQAATKSSAANAAMYYQPVINALANYGLSDKENIAAILATIALESAYLTSVKEDLYYKDAERLAGLFKRVFDANADGKISPAEIEAARPYVKNSAALDQKLYGGFRGRGLGQLTWEGNYRKVGTQLGVDFVKEPQLLERADYAAMSMVCFWVMCEIPPVAGDPKKVRRIWNGPKMLHLEEYTALYHNALKVLS